MHDRGLMYTILSRFLGIRHAFLDLPGGGNGHSDSISHFDAYLSHCLIYVPEQLLFELDIRYLRLRLFGSRNFESR